MIQRYGRLFVIATLSGAISGCFFPHTKHFAPTGKFEEQLFAKARRNIYPDDVRSDVKRYSAETVLWTGIIKEVVPAGDGKYRMRIEHHFWDWIEDYSYQKEIAFLSPRGEGLFEFGFSVSETFPLESFGAVGDMAIVYGMLKEIAPDGTVVLACKYHKTLRRELYSTGMMEYGRDGSDFKWIRKQ